MRTVCFFLIFILFGSFVLTIEPSEAIKAKEALAYCKKHGFDTNVCLLVNMSIHSGKKRFFIWDLKTNKPIASSLCCHGAGGGSTPQRPEYSNVCGSNCTSLGKYKIGKRAYSQWGINVHYKMHGQENSNSNALKRIVVLHSYDYVPEKEIYPQHLPMGWSLGCPVISNEVMRTADKILQSKKKPVLLWIYE